MACARVEQESPQQPGKNEGGFSIQGIERMRLRKEDWTGLWRFFQRQNTNLVWIPYTLHNLRSRDLGLCVMVSWAICFTCGSLEYVSGSLLEDEHGILLGPTRLSQYVR